MPMLALLSLLHASAGTAVPIPIATSPEFHAIVQKIAQLTVASKFDEAANVTRLLPGRDLKVAWNDSAVANEHRADYAAERDAGLQKWRDRLPTINLLWVKADPDVQFTFDKTATQTVLNFSEDPTKPRLMVTLPATVDPARLHNEVAYAFGSYLGVAKLPFPGFIMAHEDVAGGRRLSLQRYELNYALGIFSYAEKLRSLVKAKKTIEPSTPSLSAEIAPVKAGPVLQGERLQLKFAFNNAGDGDLQFTIVPDCSCFSRIGVLGIPGRAAGDAIVAMDTTEFTGPVHKTLYFVSNDAKAPVRSIPVEVNIQERFRFIPERGHVFAVPPGGGTFEAYLVYPEAYPLSIESKSVDGMPADVKVEPWEGTLADPSRNEGPIKRKGFKLTLNVKEPQVSGRSITTVNLATSDAKLGTLQYGLLLQKGIIAMPEQVFLGDISAAPREASFLLSRPNAAYKITSVEADSKHLSADVAPGAAVGEYKVTVRYDGKAQKGDYRAAVIVHTDDPTQPTIIVPISATIR